MSNRGLQLCGNDKVTESLYLRQEQSLAPKKKNNKIFALTAKSFTREFIPFCGRGGSMNFHLGRPVKGEANFG